MSFEGSVSWDLEFRVSNQLEHLRADGIKDNSLAMPAAITVNACDTNHRLGKILTLRHRGNILYLRL